jgi:hypothetical protein
MTDEKDIYNNAFRKAGHFHSGGRESHIGSSVQRVRFSPKSPLLLKAQ